MERAKVAMIGLDGATWSLLEAWSREGWLPNLKKLLKEACWGTLESTIPPNTAPAWISLLTGKNPGKHGVFDFVRLEDGTLRFLTSRDVKADMLYEITSKNGLTNIVIGLPLSFPPNKNFNGIMISDWLYPHKDIFPETKRHYIKKYKVIPDLFKKGRRLIEEIISTAKSQVKVARRMFLEEKWDFYFFYCKETDTVCHMFWNDLKKKTSIGRSCMKVFQIVDEFIGWVQNHMDSNTHLFLVSDHGFCEYPFAIYLNQLLAKWGFLKTKLEEVSTEELSSLPIYKLVGRELRSIDIPKPLFRLASHPRIKAFSLRLFKLIFGEEVVANLRLKVDFENSRAFLPTAHSMGLIVGDLDERERQDTINQLLSTLRELKYKNQRVFKRVLLRNEIYSGPFTNLAPDIVLVPNNFLILPQLTGQIFQEYKSGYHDQRGILLAYGSKIKRRGRIRGAKIYDIAPTILRILNLPAPRDLDGRTLQGLFSKKLEPTDQRP